MNIEVDELGGFFDTASKIGSKISSAVRSVTSRFSSPAPQRQVSQPSRSFSQPSRSAAISAGRANLARLQSTSAGRAYQAPNIISRAVNYLTSPSRVTTIGGVRLYKPALAVSAAAATIAGGLALRTGITAARAASLAGATTRGAIARGAVTALERTGLRTAAGALERRVVARSAIGAGERVAARSAIGAGERVVARSAITTGERVAARSAIGAGERVAARSAIGVGERTAARAVPSLTEKVIAGEARVLSGAARIGATEAEMLASKGLLPLVAKEAAASTEKGLLTRAVDFLASPKVLAASIAYSIWDSVNQAKINDQRAADQEARFQDAMSQLEGGQVTQDALSGLEGGYGWSGGGGSGGGGGVGLNYSPAPAGDGYMGPSQDEIDQANQDAYSQGLADQQAVDQQAVNEAASQGTGLVTSAQTPMLEGGGGGGGGGGGFPSFAPAEGGGNPLGKSSLFSDESQQLTEGQGGGTLDSENAFGTDEFDLFGSTNVMPPIESVVSTIKPELAMNYNFMDDLEVFGVLPSYTPSFPSQINDLGGILDTITGWFTPKNTKVEYAGVRPYTTRDDASKYYQLYGTVGSLALWRNYRSSRGVSFDTSYLVAGDAGYLNYLRAMTAQGMGVGLQDSLTTRVSRTVLKYAPDLAAPVASVIAGTFLKPQATENLASGITKSQGFLDNLKLALNPQIAQNALNSQANEYQAVILSQQAQAQAQARQQQTYMIAGVAGLGILALVLTQNKKGKK